MSYDNNLLNPSHPNSPYNRDNLDSPYSTGNPFSSYFNPSLSAGALLVHCLPFFFFVLMVVLAGCMTYFPFGTALAFFVSVPLACVGLYYAGKKASSFGWIFYALIFLIVVFVGLLEFIGRVEDGKSGLVSTFQSMSAPVVPRTP